MKLKLALEIPLTLLCLLFVSSPSVAGDIKCPRSISEASTVLLNDAQWTVVANSGEKQLEQVEIYLGTLSEYGAQVPDSIKKTGRKETVKWNIKHSPTDVFWIGCSYTGTTAVLFQKIDSNVKVCVATYELLLSGRRQGLSSLVCQ